ncbi:DNA-directed RNA polymerase specialized sigma24 family protein/DNA-binding XRE family transcriptional regulator [Streptomyces sp. 3330]|uniref:helix-turn-helix domain-containing protein n=1 Tax=Streptomyces sp. 3330 TaxID=2817755 RepID=UPI0028597973|nr:helix-turn-helix domain-containing protein [Streptomyces sp. 3330]MDR6975532.1 DNA-directed RNA polymerase specialized sigma24 family protein/DNA-binding XRE family transcriptional regulator [Streptomyces sp. 3330]
MTQSPAPLPPPELRRRLREAASLTQAQVAERVGVARETVRAWESGRTTPRGRRREAYAKLLASLTKADMVTNTQEAAPAPQVTVRPDKKPDPVGAGPAPTPTPSTPVTAAVPVPSPGTTPTARTPAQAFDALYAFCAPALVRQAYLLCGRRELARESVERAFQLAWQRWPEVAVDRDPAGWVRATAYEYALSPWHRFRPRYRHPEPPPADAADRVLLDVLLTLPTPYRRTLLLYDGVGLDLPETAAETEASTPATANRLLHAREAVAARLPELASPAALHRRLAEVASAERLRAPEPTAVRAGSEHRARFWTRAAIAFTVAIIGATALTVRTAPTRYEPAVPPGETVQGIPPRSAPGTLSDAERDLRAKLRSGIQHGPQRLTPLAE